jgi:hypothetical protein
VHGSTSLIEPSTAGVVGSNATRSSCLDLLLLARLLPPPLPHPLVLGLPPRRRGHNPVHQAWLNRVRASRNLGKGRNPFARASALILSLILLVIGVEGDGRISLEFCNRLETDSNLFDLFMYEPMVV